MNVSTTFASFFLVLLFVPGALGQADGREGPLPKDSRAIAVVQPALSAMGAAEAGRYMDAEIRGTAFVELKDSKAADVVIRCKGSRMSRAVFTRGNSQRTVLLNNGTLFFIEEDGKSRRLQFQNSAGARVLQLPMLSLLGEYQDPEVQVDYLGGQSVGNEGADVVGLSVLPTEVKSEREEFRLRTLTKFFISQRSGLVLKAIYEQISEDGNPHRKPVEVAFTDYKLMEGVWVPTRQVTSMDGRVVGEFLVNSVAFNVGVSESEFALPQKEQN